MRRISRIVSAAAVVCLAGVNQPAHAGGTVVVGATASVESHNPYADSQAMPYGVWCQMYGCLGTFDYRKGDYVGLLAESWEVDKADPRNWIFHLRKGLKRHGDGKELTAGDVVHSINRIRTDPKSRQKQNIRPVKKAVAIDKYTVKIITKAPTAPLLEYLFDRVMITGKDLFDTHGARKADREYPWGWGSYRLKEVKIGQRIVMEKVPGHPWAKPENPDVLIFRIMREAEQRVTALVNKEIQIAQYIPPHLAKRVEASANAKVSWTSSNRIIFLAMSPKHKPWDNRLLRKAVCHAIDRSVLVKHILGGYAEQLTGPIGPGQYGYDAHFAGKYLTVPYDPAKAKALVKQSGYNGAEVELFTPVNRFVNDKQVTQAIIPMLKAVGINATLKTPEWSTMWPNVRKGKIGFFYIGRGGVVDPSVALAQYFETGGSPRIGISDPAIDSALKRERVTFNPAERKVALNNAFKAIVDASPACFLWRHHVLYGVAENVTYAPSPSDRVFGFEMTVKQ
jgi:peptide/nickel transport system substrate-binding protein